MEPAEPRMEKSGTSHLGTARARLDRVRSLVKVGHWYTDLKTGATYWTPEFFELSGMPRPSAPMSLIGDGPDLVRRFTHPDDRQRVVDDLNAVVRDGETRTLRYRWLTEDGRTVWIEGVVARGDGDEPALVGSAIDVTERLQTERALHDSLARMERLERLVQVGHWSTDLRTRETTWSEGMFALSRTERAAAPPVWRGDEAVRRFVAPEEQARFTATFRRVIKTGRSTRIEFRALRSDGTDHWVEMFLAREDDDAGVPVRVVGTDIDVTERVNRDRELRALVTQVERINALTHVGHWWCDLRTGVLTWSDELYAIAKRSRDDGADAPYLVGGFSALRHLCHPDDFERVAAALRAVMKTGRLQRVECRYVRGDGSVHWVENAFAREDDADGHPVRVVGTVLDVSERKAAEARLAFHARFDTLTGLANRAQLLERLTLASARAARHDGGFAVMFVDLDEFKSINDIFGHTAGDEVLRSVAARLRRVVRDTDLVARTGGDEFVVLLEDATDRNGPARIARRIIDAVRRPVDVAGDPLAVGASIGIACYPEDGRSPEDLIRNADTAMYEAKREGRGCFRFFTEAMHEAAVERFRLERELRAALERGELRVHYQPIVNLEGRMKGCEALVRWAHPSGMRLPAEFIGLAEETGLIVEVGRFVLRVACRDAARWQRFGPLTVAVNVSARQLQRIDFVGDVSRALEQSGLAPGLLELELTETAISQDLRRTGRVLDELRGLGVRLSIDDFGTGYNSLASLRTCAVDTIKIDRSFVDELDASVNDRAIAAAVISAAHKLGARVVAEGVETEAQRRALVELGCDDAQGYLFSPAIPASEVDALLASGPAAAVAAG